MSKSSNDFDPDDRRLEFWLSNLLRGGVTLALTLLVIAFAINYVRGQSWLGATDMAVLTSGAAGLRSDPPRNLAEFVYGFGALQSLNFVQGAILILILLPAFRVAFLMGSFFRQRDWAFTVLALLVLVFMSIGTVLQIS